MSLDLTLLSLVPGVGKLIAVLPQILQIATALIAAASAIAAILPHPAQLDGWIGTARKIVDWLALNVGHATPAATAANSTRAPRSATGVPKSALALVIAGGLAAALTLGLSACAAPETPQQTVFDMRAAYDAAVLVPMTHYAALPTCATGVSATAAAPCKSASVLASLVKADTSAKAALDAAEDMVRNQPTLDATAAIAAATDAISAAEAIVTTYNIQ
ncbi:MAG TPA: hypothetical protein VMF53_15970 [Alphaproteobacteria bacterium]|nr:hypothetical protein [Alphaproteobacteria bacterium]